jgi:hypothetical protein
MSESAIEVTDSIVPDWDQLGPWLKDLEKYLEDIDDSGSMEALFGLNMFLATVTCSSGLHPTPWPRYLSSPTLACSLIKPSGYCLNKDRSP